jgi:hypothetical protein
MLRKLLFVLMMVILAACASGGTGSDPAQTVERYLQAKVDGDRDALQGLICASMEQNLDREAASFSGVDARLEGMDCTFNQDASTVTCSGEIVATYGGEDRNFALSTYIVVQEDGEWKWCGEGG